MFVIFSNNKGNYYSPILLVVPITSSTTKNDIPTHVKIQLKVPSIILCEQIHTINKDNLIEFGFISSDFKFLYKEREEFFTKEMGKKNYEMNKDKLFYIDHYCK